MFVAEEPEGNTEEKDIKSQSPLRSPEFFNSLSEAHPKLNTSLDELETKENNHRLHTRNMFAQKSPSRKPRFNLNAMKPKEVKSRFVIELTKIPLKSYLLKQYRSLS